MAFSDVATLGFVGTNYNKVSSGDWTRIPVLGAQIVNSAKAGAQVTNFTANCASQVSEAVKVASENSKLFNGLAKIVDFASKNVNTLIGASCIAKVVLANKEDRKKVALTEGGCFAGMFIGEGLMKKGYLEKLLDKLPIEKKWRPVVKGILFVAGSLTASGIGQKTCAYIADKYEKKTQPHLDFKS